MPHGGHLAAQLLAAMAGHAGDGGLSARSLTIHFTSAAEPGEMEIATAVERSGRSLSTLSARATQDGRLVALALAALGRDRDGPDLQDASFPDVPHPEELDAPPHAGISAPVRDHYDMRFAGGLPHEGGAASSGGWIRPTVPRAPDDLLTTALADLWIPAVLVPLSERIPTTTVELTINFLAPPGGLPDDGWYLTWFGVPVAAHGYFREEGEVWGGDGRLLARSSQLGAFLMRNG